MQLCSICNYESPEGAKFCRQCGAPLYAESEMSGADTRNYGRQDNGPILSAPLPKPAPSVVDAFGSETARYYKAPAPAGVGTSNLPNIAPMYAQHAPVYMPPIQNTAPIKTKKRRLLKWAGGLLLLIIAGGIGAGINEESNEGRFYLSRDDQARLERLRAEDRLNHATFNSVIEMNHRLREELDRRAEDIERAKEEAERAAERGSTGLDEKQLDLKDYEYPNSTSARYSHVVGKELMTLRTQDNFETLVDFYKRKLGDPLIILTERNNKRAIFQSTGTPSTTILVQETNDRNREKIIALRSPFRLRKPTAGQAEVVASETTIVTDGKKVLTVDTKPAQAKPVNPAQPAPAQAPRKPE
jgi:hypothetical protein